MRSLLLPTFALVAASASAQINISANLPVTVNFDGITGQSANQGNNGILFARGIGTQSTLTAASGSTTTGGLYSFGATGSTDRALGSLGSNATGDTAYGVAFRNAETATSLRDLKFSFRYEVWRDGGNSTANRSQSVLFSYAVTSAVGALPTTATATDFIPLAAGNFEFTGGASGSAQNVGATINVQLPSSVTVPAGSVLTLRWFDANHGGTDHSFAIDDVRMEAVPEPASMAVLGLGLAAFRRRRANK